MCNFTYSQGKGWLDTCDTEWASFDEFHRELGASEGAREDCNPTDPILVLRLVEGKYRAEKLRFGLIPHWFDPERHRRTINTQARSETVAQLPSFREPFRKRRCIVVIDGFYEWDDSRVKTSIRRTDGTPLLIAGLWDRWISPDGEVVEGAAMVTTEATAWMLPYQDRQPLFLEPAEVPAWVEGSVEEAAALMRVSQVSLEASPPRTAALF